MVDKFEKFGCEFMNEGACEENLNEEGVTLEEAEAERFGE